jgi:adenine-specific DNA-methyltransferase
MARKSKESRSDKSLSAVTDYRYEDKRKNNPPAKIAAEGFVPLVPKAEYSYSPRRPPELRFDPTGAADRLPELVAKATREPLTAEEAQTLADALRMNEPWLEWAGKREQTSFSVDPVALHIHERVSTQAILRVAAREDVNRSLFADPEQDYNEAVQFYRHDVDWSNRLILGDSLQVMSSLALREDLAGKVQMIYIDPPYGIKFASNFQPEIGRREVKEKESDLTREAEVVRAYRDTWQLGVHSYLSYLRQRLCVAKDLLAESGSIFVQIGDENTHRVRAILDEVFGAQNCIAFIGFVKTALRRNS